MRRIIIIIAIMAIIGHYNFVNAQRVNKKSNYKEITLGTLYNFNTFGIIGTFKHKYNNLPMFGEVTANWCSLNNQNNIINQYGYILLVGYQIGYIYPLKAQINIPLDLNFAVGANFGHEIKIKNSEVIDINVNEEKYIYGFLGNVSLNYFFSHDIGARVGYNLNYIVNSIYTDNMYSYLTLSLIKKF